MKQIYELKGQGCSIREIARRLEISRNTVREYVGAPEIPKPKPRPKRGSNRRRTPSLVVAPAVSI